VEHPVAIYKARTRQALCVNDKNKNHFKRTRQALTKKAEKISCFLFKQVYKADRVGTSEIATHSNECSQ